MISKLIIWAPDRETARKKSIEALKNFVVQGIQTNIAYLLGMLQHTAFETNKLSTKFCDEHTEEILENISNRANSLNVENRLLAYALFSLMGHKEADGANIWERIGFWRSVNKLDFEMDNQHHQLYIDRFDKNGAQGSFEGYPFDCRIQSIADASIQFTNGDTHIHAYISHDNKQLAWLNIDGNSYKMSRMDMLNMEEDHVSASGSDDGGNLFSPMPGKVIKVNVKEGDEVSRGTVLLVVEAMKMENNIVAANHSTVTKLMVCEGEMVDKDKQLVFLEPIEEE